MNPDGDAPADYPIGADTVWIGSDSRGHVAAFVTAGEGPIPVTVENRMASLCFEPLRHVEASAHLRCLSPEGYA